jgi:hypothetical protein
LTGVGWVLTGVDWQLFECLTELQLVRATDLFERVDANGDGYLELSEIKGFFASAFDDEFLGQVNC